MADKDMDRMLQNDVQKFKDIQNGTDDFSIPKVLESVLWGLSFISVVTMMAVMPWVGPNKPIPGILWLGYSLLGICLFGAGALIVRIVFSSFGNDVNKTMTRKFEGR